MRRSLSTTNALTIDINYACNIFVCLFIESRRVCVVYKVQHNFHVVRPVQIVYLFIIFFKLGVNGVDDATTRRKKNKKNKRKFPTGVRKMHSRERDEIEKKSQRIL